MIRGIGVTIFILSLCQVAFGQFAIIDKVGAVNVKSGANVGSNVVAKLVDGSVVCSVKNEDDGWVSIEYNLGKLNKSGFIPKSAVKLIDSIAKVPCRNLTENFATWSADSVLLTVATIPFDPQANKLLYGRGTSLSSSAALVKINDKEIWGTDGNIPKVQYGKVELQYGQSRVFLPFDNMFEPNLKNIRVYHDWKTKTLYIVALNGDGAGAYAALWIVENGKFKSRTLTVPFL